MSAEFFKMIAYVGMIVFLNCVIAAIIDLLFIAFLSCSGDVVDKEEVAEKFLILTIVIAVISLITSLDGSLLYFALSNK